MAKIRTQLVFRPDKPNYDNLEKIKFLEKLTFPTDQPYERHSACYWWGFFSGKEMIGYAGLDPNRTRGFLCACGILPKYRGLGLQKKAIVLRTKYAKKIGLSCVHTYTSSDNFPSICSLLKCGYIMFKAEKYDPRWISFKKEF